MLNGEYTVLVENMWLTDILAVILLLIPFFLIFYDKKYLFAYYVISIVANLPLIFMLSFGFSYELIIGFFIFVTILKDLFIHKSLRYTTTKESIELTGVLIIILIVNIVMSFFNFNPSSILNRSIIYLVNLFILFVFTYYLTNHQRLEVVKNGFVIGAVVLVGSMIVEMVYGYQELNVNYMRPGGLLLDPNVCAFALNLSLVISFFQPRENNVFSDLISIASKVAILFGVFLTVSRSGYISTIVILILVLIFYSRGRKSWIPATTVSVFILMYFLFFNSINNFFFNMIQIIDLGRIFKINNPPPISGGNRPPDIDFSNGRLDIILSSVEIFRNNFLTGVGIGNVTKHMKKTINVEMNSHNLYLQLMVESGFIMLFMFVLFFVYLVRLIKKAPIRKRYFMFIIIIVVFLEGMFNHNILNINIVWLILAFFLSVVVINSKQQKILVFSKKTFTRKRKYNRARAF